MTSIVNIIQKKFLTTFIAMQISLLCVFSVAGYFVIQTYGASKAQEKATNIVEVFESLGRFGDTRYSKFIVSSLGKSLGLTSFHLFDETGAEIQGNPYKVEDQSLPPAIFALAKDMTEKRKLVFEKNSLKQSRLAYAIKMDNGETLIAEITFERTQSIWVYSILFVVIATALTALIAAFVTRKQSRQIGAEIDNFSSLVKKAHVENVELPEAVFQELQPVSDAFQILMHRLREQAKASAIAQMTQMLAHDVRKPFSSLQMVLGALPGLKSLADVQSICSVAVPEISRSLETVNGLIHDVMAISLRTEPIVEPVEVHNLLETALMDIFREYTKAEVKIDYKLNHTSILLIEKAKVLRVFSNIIGNALQAMNFKGSITIETRNADAPNFIEFIVANDGPHIPAEHLPKLFDTFFTHGKKGGTGLGLAIAHKVVTMHGGTIRCESAPSKGVAFIFTLPAEDTKTQPHSIALPCNSTDFVKAALATPAFTKGIASEDEEETKLIDIFNSSALNLTQKLRILLLDDEQIYRNGLSEKLLRYPKIAAHLEVVSVATPDEALASPAPDLAIIDVDLGCQSINGFDVVAKLRERGDKGLLCTHSNHVLACDQKTALEHGADVFLPKPMSTVQLLKLLCQAIERLNVTTPSGQTKTEASLVSAFVDDVKTIRMAWELSWPIGKLVTFATPELFWSHVETNPDFLKNLACVVTDLNFGNLSPLDGRDFARQLKEQSHLPVFVATNSDVSVSDFEGAVAGVLPKAPPDHATLEKLLKKC